MSAKVIIFGNQKGGAGKTTHTEGLASYIHLFLEKDILVIDADYQKSIEVSRKAELEEGDEYILKHLKPFFDPNQVELLRKYEEQISKNEPTNLKDYLYDIISKNPQDIPQFFETVKDQYEYVIIDMPGNMTEKGILKTYALADLVVVPTELTDKSNSSTTQFLSIMTKASVPCKILINRPKKNTADFKQFIDHKTEYEEIWEYSSLNNIAFDSTAYTRKASTIGLMTNYKNEFVGKPIYQEIIDTLN